VSANHATIVRPRIAIDDPEWLAEIHNVEIAVNALLEAKRRTLREDPVREQVLWLRYVERLRAAKRKLDAAAF
jgi:hypothetical protein